MTKLKSVSLTIAKIAAVAIALLTLGCFVWKAQESANPPAPGPAPAPVEEAAPAPARTPSAAEASSPKQPAAQPLEEITAPPSRTFLPSSKSLVIEMDPAAQREPTLMFSSKSAVLIEPTPQPTTEPTPLRNPTLIFGSKSAVLIEPTPEPAPQVFLPSSKSGRPIPVKPRQQQQQQ